MNSGTSDRAQPRPGSPIRTPSDQSPLAGSPRHIAGCNVLLRLPVPRHPPNALQHLQQHAPTHNVQAQMLASTIRFPTTTPPPHTPPTRAHGQHGHSTQTPDSMPVNALPQPQPTRTTHAARRLLPRKEVIQPHLPVRLPCYDFVPIANPTFDHSPRTNRLGHELRVLPTFVT